MRPCSDTLLVWTGGACVCGCANCPIDQRVAPAGVTPAELLAALAGVPERAGRLAVLVGGEPLLRPDLMRLLAAIRVSGCVPGIITTGRPLVYATMRERLRRAGVAYLRVQLFGVGVAHDRATAVSGAYEQTIAGLRAWLSDAGGDGDVDVALTVRGRPAQTVPTDVEQLAGAIDSSAVQFVISVDPPAAQSEDRAMPWQPLEALSRWNDDTSRPLLAWEGIPPAADSSPQYLTAPSLGPAFLGGATVRASCLGNTVGRAGRTAGPPAAPKANSFNFVRTSTAVPWTAGS